MDEYAKVCDNCDWYIGALCELWSGTDDKIHHEDIDHPETDTCKDFELHQALKGQDGQNPPHNISSRLLRKGTQNE